MTPEPALTAVAVPDGHLAVQKTGTGPPVVLLHGGALDHRLWAPQIEPLARRHHVVAVDARGHGWSSTPTAPFRHGDDLAAVLGALDLGPATLVGLSMGAATAVDTTIAHPHLVRGLVVSGGGAGDPTFRDPDLLAAVAEWERAGARGDREAWLAAFLRLGLGPDRDPDALAPGIRDAVLTMARHTLDAHVGDTPPITGSALPGARARAHEIAVPVLAVSGRDDFADPRRPARELVDLTGGHSVEIAGGHYPNLEDPDRFTGLLLDFLDEPASRSR